MAVATRPLGRTGRTVSELGFGCGGWFAHAWMHDDGAVALINRALKLGITVFDTSPAYGDGRSEIRLGRGLEILGPARDHLLISTKVGTVKFGSAYAKDFGPDAVEAQVVDSLDRLGLQTIPLLVLDAPNPAHLTDDLLDTVVALKGDGVVGLLGVTGDDTQIAAAMSTGLMDVIMPVHNVVDRSCDDLISLAEDAGLGVIAARGLARMAPVPAAGSWLSPADWWAAINRWSDREAAAAAGAYRFLDAVEGWNAADASLGYLLTDNRLSSALFSTTRMTHLRANLAVSGRALPEDLRRRIERGGHP